IHIRKEVFYVVGFCLAIQLQWRRTLVLHNLLQHIQLIIASYGFVSPKYNDCISSTTILKSNNHKLLSVNFLFKK
ncbi:MAG: hypothetical protein ACOVNY_01650, partial [Chitinophagaceae bacterium]